MSTIAEKRSMANMTDNYVGYDELDPKAVIYDARGMHRASAIRAFTIDHDGDFASVKCTTRYARWMTRAEQWDDFGQEHWADKLIDEYPGNAKLDSALKWRDEDTGELIEHLFKPPDAPPVEWEPNEERDPTWAFCDKTAEGAIKVYVCELRERA